MSLCYAETFLTCPNQELWNMKNLARMIKFVSDQADNTVGKGENAFSLRLLLLFHQYLQISFFFSQDHENI